MSTTATIAGAFGAALPAALIAFPLTTLVMRARPAMRGGRGVAWFLLAWFGSCAVQAYWDWMLGTTAVGALLTGLLVPALISAAVVSVAKATSASAT